ncbi:MAG: hypothetical protein N3B18_11080 [Desulfobacterota bacterium]|nr:hypothetical protein [Thermodesulfobacteriota bacterium]
MNKKDRELIEQIEALEEIISWLEQKEKTDLSEASATMSVDEDEVDEWLRSPELEKVREWLKK